MELSRIKLMLIFIFAVVIFFPLTAEARTENCSTTKFSDGTISKSLIFSPGGGYNTDAKVSLPMQAFIGATTVDLVPQTVVGTPYVWIPQSSGSRIYQIETDTGVIVAASPYGTGGNPSRVTVMPGGDVWVANKGTANLTRLSPAVLPAYSVSGTYPVGSGPRGVTFDYKGNIWAFDYYDATVWKFTAPGYASSSFANGAGYPYIYGAIGDPYGYVWMVGDLNNPGTGNRRVNILNTKTNAITLADFCTINGSTYIYGIGMDNQGNILVANYGGGGFCKIGGIKSGASFGKILQTISTTPAGSRGIAADGNNNVWMANSTNNHVYVFGPGGGLLKDLVPGVDFGSTWPLPINYTPGPPANSGFDMIGVAIDFDNNAWVVSNGRGHVIKLGAVGAVNQYTVIYDINLGGSLYNYSDMTGFRSIPNVLSVGSTEYTPITGNTYTNFGGAIQTILRGTTCTCPDVNGVEQCAPDPAELDSCLVPLSLFSITGGTYEAKNLNIGCTTAIAPVLGGLVPCGRLDNDSNTSWDDTAPCNLCFGFLMLQNIVNWLTQIAVAIAVFILVIAGLFYAFSSGDPGKIELAKSVISRALTGLALIFIAWLLINIIIAALGYSHPFTGGSWNIVNCSL